MKQLFRRRRLGRCEYLRYFALLCNHAAIYNCHPMADLSDYLHLMRDDNNRDPHLLIDAL